MARLRRVSSLAWPVTLLVLAACSGPAASEDESFIFTEDDLAAFQQMTDDPETVSGAVQEMLEVDALPSGSDASSAQEVVLDLSNVQSFDALREGPGGGYTVTNTFLNVRAEPSVSAAVLVRLNRGDAVNVESILDGTWAQVALSDGRKGYVAHRYIAKYVTEETLAAERAKYANTYFVNFGYVNVRAEPSQDSEKIGEIPGQVIVEPSEMHDGWAKVSHGDLTGWVSTDYIQSLEIETIVRQDTFRIPMVHYHLTGTDDATMLSAMAEQLRAIRSRGIALKTMRELRAMLEKDTPNADEGFGVVIGISGVTAENIRSVSETLNAVGTDATLFIETRHLGLSGITEKTLLTMMANGFDIQSGGHTGDDIRALTNAQAELELKQSRKLLEEYIRKPVYAIAWPRGGSNERIRDIAANAGYLFGVGEGSSVTVKRQDLLSIPAMTVLAGTTTEDIVQFVDPNAEEESDS